MERSGKMGEVGPSLRPKHKATAVHAPDGSSIEVDAKLLVLVQQCWRLGLATRACCQGDPEPAPDAPRPARDGTPDHPAARQAYIAFSTSLHAMAFAASAGPTAWGSAKLGSRRTDAVDLGSGYDHWILRDRRVGFPHRDIGRAVAALKRCTWTIRELVANEGSAER
jgi:hypothetical protein